MADQKASSGDSPSQIPPVQEAAGPSPMRNGDPRETLMELLDLSPFDRGPAPDALVTICVLILITLGVGTLLLSAGNGYILSLVNGNFWTAPLACLIGALAVVFMVARFLGMKVTAGQQQVGWSILGLAALGVIIVAFYGGVAYQQGWEPRYAASIPVARPAAVQPPIATTPRLTYLRRKLADEVVLSVPTLEGSVPTLTFKNGKTEPFTGWSDGVVVEVFPDAAFLNAMPANFQEQFRLPFEGVTDGDFPVLVYYRIQPNLTMPVEAIRRTRDGELVGKSAKKTP